MLTTAAGSALILIKERNARTRYIFMMWNIGEAFAHDHRRLEQALEASAAHVRAAQWDVAAIAFAAFRGGIERHMQVEEQVLFPAIEGGAETPLTATLRKGHRDLRVFFDELDDALKSRDAEEYGRIAASMRTLLARHDEKEEAELYPAAQALLGAEAAAVAARLGG
jgi:hemerythrin-like domain-containing protein